VPLTKCAGWVDPGAPPGFEPTARRSRKPGGGGQPILVWGVLSQELFCWVVAPFSKGFASRAGGTRCRPHDSPFARRTGRVKAGALRHRAMRGCGLDAVWPTGHPMSNLQTLTFGLRLWARGICRGRSEGSSPWCRGSARSNLVFGDPDWDRTMMQPYASVAELRRAGPFYRSGTRAMDGCGTPPPRIVIGNCARSGTRAEPLNSLCWFCFPQIAACKRIPAGSSPVVASRHNMISSLRASATIMVFLVVRRPSWVRWRNHWASALSG
jgi:hypothetical protein